MHYRSTLNLNSLIVAQKYYEGSLMTELTTPNKLNELSVNNLTHFLKKYYK